MAIGDIQKRSREQKYRTRGNLTIEEIEARKEARRLTPEQEEEARILLRERKANHKANPPVRL